MVMAYEGSGQREDTDMALIGASLEDLATSERLCQRSADQLVESRNAIERALSSVYWLGPVATNFRSDWSNNYAPRVTSGSQVLIQMATTLRRNLEEQRRASAADGAFGAQLATPTSSDPQTGGNGKNLPDPKPQMDDGFLWFDGDRDKLSTKDYYGKKLFPNGDPSPNDVQQGQLGDCWVLATLGSMAASSSGRDLIKKMIVDNGDGTYTVTFGDGKAVVVDGDLYVNKNGNPQYARGDGNWVQIIEKAYAARSKDFENLDGGYQTNAIKVLTGSKTGTMDLDPLIGFDPSKKDVLALVSDQLARGKIVTASGEHHAWSIVGVTDGKLLIRNPWGNSSGAPDFAAKMGAEKDSIDSNGYFLITVENFKRKFDDIEYEK